MFLDSLRFQLFYQNMLFY